MEWYYTCPFKRKMREICTLIFFVWLIKVFEIILLANWSNYLIHVLTILWQTCSNKLKHTYFFQFRMFFFSLIHFPQLAETIVHPPPPSPPFSPMHSASTAPSNRRFHLNFANHTLGYWTFTLAIMLTVAAPATCFVLLYVFIFCIFICQTPRCKN